MVDEQGRKLPEDNRLLRAKNKRLEQGQGQGQPQPQPQVQGQKPKKSSCMVIAIVAVVAGGLMLPILLAIAVPMYSTFKQRTKVAAVLQSAESTAGDLADWYRSGGNIESLEFSPEGNMFTVNGEPIGVSLPTVAGLRWAADSGSECVLIEFQWERGCPPELCDGSLEVCCNIGGCLVSGTVGEGDAFGFDFGSRTLR